MELNLTKDTVKKKNVRYRGVVEETAEATVNLPDYCPGINKVINTCTDANVNSVWVNSGKVIIDGGANFRILYQTDDGKCAVYEISVPFTKSVDVADVTENDMLRASASCEQVNCRVLSPMCAEVKASLAIELNIEYITDTQYISACRDDCIKKLNKSFNSKAYAGTMFADFTVSDQFDCARASSDPVKIYRTDVTPCLNEYKCIKNKIMIKGIYLIKIVYLTPDGDLCTQNESIPFSQVFDNDAFDENSVCCIKLQPRCVNVSCGSDKTMQKGRIEISITSDICADIYNDVCVEYIEDAFSPEYDIKLTGGAVDSVNLSDSSDDILRAEFKIDTSAHKDSQIVDISVRKIKYNTSLRESDRIIFGNIYFDIILKTPDGNYVMLQKADEFSFDRGNQSAADEFIYTIFLNDMTFSSDSSGIIRIDAQFCIKEIKINKTTHNAVVDIQTGDRKQSDSSNYGLTVYFAHKGESVWNIAKAHCGDMNDIMTVNGIDSDILDGDRTLIFSAG